MEIESVTQEPNQSVANSPGFVTFAKCFCINPVYHVGHYKKRKGWVLIELATRVETNFKLLRSARQHLIQLYMAVAPEKIATAGLP